MTLRRTTRWAALLLAAILLTANTLSIWGSVGFTQSQPAKSRYFTAAIYQGSICFGYGGLFDFPEVPWEGWRLGWEPPGIQLVPTLPSGIGSITIIPLWFATLPACAIAAWLWCRRPPTPPADPANDPSPPLPLPLRERTIIAQR